MNLIQQLQQTPKWKEFEAWYESTSLHYYIQLYTMHSLGGDPVDGFVDLSFSFQKGVFEKFIKNQGYHLCTERRKNGKGLVLVPILYVIPQKGDSWTQCLINDNCDTFEELLIWYFNLVQIVKNTKE